METRTLTPELTADWLAVMDNGFGDNPDWAGCYCAYYEDPMSGEEWDPSDPDQAAANRSAQCDRIAAGAVHGLLAYDEGRPVGWLSAGPRGGYGNLRGFEVAIDPDDPPVGSVMCFVVRPEHRGRGVGSALLAAVDDHFQALGLSVAEGYPRRASPTQTGFEWTSNFYKGSPAMFAAAGYTVHAEHERFTVVRRGLGR